MSPIDPHFIENLDFKEAKNRIEKRFQEILNNLPEDLVIKIGSIKMGNDELIDNIKRVFADATKD